MRASLVAKRLALRLGVYPIARAAQRHVMDRSSLRRFRNDVAFYGTLIPPGSLCFDVGANTGEKSEALISAGARVVAFEPNPAVREELEARCSGFERWTFVPVALGSEAGFLELYARTMSTYSSLSSDWEGQVMRTYQVPVLTLDKAMAHFGVPYYCKIDVEGWELEVLRGLSQSIPLLSFEYHLTEQGVEATRSCLRRLQGFGAWEVNVTGPEEPALRLPEWMPVDQFLKWFPGGSQDRLDVYYGDVFMRRSGTQLRPSA